MTKELKEAFIYYFEKSNSKGNAAMVSAVGTGVGVSGAVAAAPLTAGLSLFGLLPTAVGFGIGMADGKKSEQAKAKACFIWMEVRRRGLELEYHKGKDRVIWWIKDMGVRYCKLAGMQALNSEIVMPAAKEALHMAGFGGARCGV